MQSIYLHELDDFIKQELKEPYYLRYCDDFIILSNSESNLKPLIGLIRISRKKSSLNTSSKKVIVRKLSQGIDFVGYVLFEKYTLVRTRTKQRLKRKLKEGYECYLKGKMDKVQFDQRLQSYLGILYHANQHTLSPLKNTYWIREDSVSLRDPNSKRTKNQGPFTKSQFSKSQ